MRPAVSVALIVCGAIIVVIPPVYDYLLAQMGASVMVARTDMASINVGEPLSQVYRFGCFALGAAMIVIAIVGAFKKTQS